MDADTIVNSMARRVPKPTETYLGDDAVEHCAVCHQPVEALITILGQQKMLPVICQCKQMEIEADETRRKQELINARRRACFGGDRVSMMSCTFERDARYNEQVSDICMAYARYFRRHYEDGKGLLLYGNVGTGKTFYAAAICNYVIDEGNTAMMTTFNSISNQLMAGFDGKAEVMAELRRPSLLVLDDLGAERGTEYMQEVVFSVIDERIKTGKPLIITGNLTGEQFARPATLHQQRIYDRILQACLPVEVVGKSIRRKDATEWHRQELMRMSVDIAEMNGGTA
jgi:DNA replication protein DnaC